MMKMMKVAAITAIMGITLLLPNTTVYAEELFNTTTVNYIEVVDEQVTQPTNEPTKDTTNGIYNSNELLPDVSVGDMTDKIIGKANELVVAFREILNPICIIGFMVACMVAVYGTMAKKGGVGKGVFAMVFCGIAYTCINYADVIMNAMQTWLVK